MEMEMEMQIKMPKPQAKATKDASSDQPFKKLAAALLKWNLEGLDPGVFFFK